MEGSSSLPRVTEELTELKLGCVLTHQAAGFLCRTLSPLWHEVN